MNQTAEWKQENYKEPDYKMQLYKSGKRYHRRQFRAKRRQRPEPRNGGVQVPQSSPAIKDSYGGPAPDLNQKHEENQAIHVCGRRLNQRFRSQPANDQHNQTEKCVQAQSHSGHFKNHAASLASEEPRGGA